MHLKSRTASDPFLVFLFTLFMIMSLAVTPMTASASTSFSDVQESDYFYNPVRWAVDKGMCQGTGDGKFSPSNPSPRAYICYYLWVYKGRPSASATSPFTDLAGLDSTVKKAVEWAYQKGYVSGKSKTVFGVNDTITRGQLITILWRFAGSPASSASISFSDVPAGKYFTDAVRWAVANRIAAGTTAETFSPNYTCTKAHVLTFLYKMAGSPYGTKTATQTVGKSAATTNASTASNTKSNTGSATSSNTNSTTEDSTGSSNGTSARDSGGPAGMSAANYKVLTNVIGAVESGGQVYGQRDYSCYAGAYENSPKEYTCTLGWCQLYGEEGEDLIKRIKAADPAGFAAIDSEGLIAKKLSSDWVAEKWNPSASEKAVLIKLITSDVGKAQQDAYFRELTTPFVTACENTYTTNTKAIMMYVEIRHLGGKNSVDRIFKRCNGKYTLSNILASLKKDQADTSSNNQVGDALFTSRHQKCVEFIEKYTVG